MAALSSKVPAQAAELLQSDRSAPAAVISYPTRDGSPIAEAYLHLYAMLLPDELTIALQQAQAEVEAERQRAVELEAQLARYRQQFGDLL